MQRASQTLSIDTEQTTLEQLLGLLKSELAFVRPQVMRGDTYLFESGEGLVIAFSLCFFFAFCFCCCFLCTIFGVCSENIADSPTIG